DDSRAKRIVQRGIDRTRSNHPRSARTGTGAGCEVRIPSRSVNQSDGASRRSGFRDLRECGARQEDSPNGLRMNCTPTEQKLREIVAKKLEVDPAQVPLDQDLASGLDLD